MDKPQPSEIYGVMVGGLSLFTNVFGGLTGSARESAKANLHWAIGHRTYEFWLEDEDDDDDDKEAGVGAYGRCS